MTSMRTLMTTAAVAAIISASSALPTQAAPIIFTGSGTADTVAATASATFTISGNTLTVVLQNTSPDNAGTDRSGSTLSGVFFNLTGNPALTPVSATVVAGSIVGAACVPGPCNGTTTNVGGEWGYQATSFPGSADRGIASSGYLTTGLAGDIGNFNNGAAGTNLDDPDSLDGINFGIISDDPTFNPNGGLANDPLVRDFVTFVLTGVNGLTEADISNVSFQYGTALTEANIPGNPPPGGPPPGQAPEPGTLAILGAALVGFGLARRRRPKGA